MFWRDWKPRPTAAQRKASAAKEVKKRAKAGQQLRPIPPISGRKVAQSFWGAAWCDHLEGHADYSNRLPRGRSYVRNGSVLDLRVENGKVQALVQGSSLYTVEITIGTMAPQRWKNLVARCAGRVDSMVELLQGTVSNETLKHLTDPKAGMFPTAAEMEFSCSCPDWAEMCKHVAATLYGVGARLDAAPELLFTLRNVDQSDLVKTSVGLAQKKPTKRALKGTDLAAVFGIELASGDAGRKRTPSGPSARVAKKKSKPAQRKPRAAAVARQKR